MITQQDASMCSDYELVCSAIRSLSAADDHVFDAVNALSRMHPDDLPQDVLACLHTAISRIDDAIKKLNSPE